MFVHSPMGKNTIAQVPKDMASLIEKEDSTLFTFHLLRRSSATCAADSGTTIQQMMDFYGWKNTNMPQKCVLFTKASVKGMAEKLQGVMQPDTDNSSVKDTSSGSSSVPANQSSVGDGGKIVCQGGEKIIIIEKFEGTLNM